jgi:polyhydroxybutyrate depolymerase
MVVLFALKVGPGRYHNAARVLCRRAMRSRTFLFHATAALIASALATAACGTNDVQQGHWAGTPADAGPRPDAGPSAEEIYPTSDPDPAGATHDAPTFEPSTPPSNAPFACAGGTRTLASGERVVTVTSGGLPRTAIVHVPKSYDPTKGTMLVLNFHGFSSDALQELVISRMNPASEAKNFVVVYPYGVGNSWNSGDCCGDSWTGGVDDVAYVKALLAQLAADYCVDPKRIYATGFSNGGFLAYRLACEMSDVFAAVAPVSGVEGFPASACTPSRAVPVIHFHGTSDPVVKYNGGTPVIPLDIAAGITFRSVDETIQIWRTKDGCLASGKTIFQHGDTTCVDYGTCRDGAQVTLCTIDGGGHTWPGGVPIPFLGKTSKDISATDTMVSFFLAHPL